jgi:2-dehydro-3-deoxyphosphogluconate aldolase/(4S)-4-hydroxy-2-oxoglutarate aldolase
VGGVDLKNTADFFRAGVAVVGVGGELVNQKLLDGRDFAAITELALGFRHAADEGRKK